MKPLNQKPPATTPTTAPRVTASLQLVARFEEDRSEDVATLESINSLITRLLSSSESDAELLQEIGNQAKKIKFKDASPSYIRNKYGVIDRHHNSAIRPDGLPLTHLEALAKIGEEPAALAEIANHWRDDISSIKQKIILILAAEKEPAIKTYEQVLTEFEQIPKPTNFTRDVGRLYVGKITKKILEILNDQNLSRLDFNSREDRYYFSNVVLKIGELSRELIEFTNPSQESGLFSFFKKIRNSAAHSPQLMIDDLDEAQIKNLKLLKNILRTDFALRANNVMNREGAYDLGRSSEEEKKWQKDFLKSVFAKTAVASEGLSSYLNKDQQEIRENLLASLMEIEYVQWVMSNEAIDPAKKNYIIEFGIAKIAHCLNDANKSANPLLQKHGSRAVILQDSWLNTIRARNEKIAHGVIGFDKAHSLQELANNIATMRGDIAALLDISSVPVAAVNTKIAEDVLDFRYRGDLARVAHKHIQLGNSAEARNILQQALQYFDEEAPIMALSKDVPLVSRITSAASENPAARFLCKNQYFAKLEEGNLFETEALLMAAMERIPSFIASLGRGESMSQALGSLNEQDQDKTKLLLAVDYFHIQHRVLRLLSQTYSNTEMTELEPLYHRIAGLEEKIYGKVLKETLMLQGFLLKDQGRAAESQEKFNLATQTLSGDKFTTIETLLHQSRALEDGGGVVQARECLGVAEELTNSQPIHHFATLMLLSEVALFEARQGRDIARSLKYLDRAQKFFEENKLVLKSSGNAFVSAERVLMHAGIAAVSAKYSPDEIEEEVALSRKDIAQLERLHDQATRLHRLQGEDYDSETWKVRVANLTMILEVVSVAASNREEFAPNFLAKASSLRALYQIAEPRGGGHEIMMIQVEVMKIMEGEPSKEEVVSRLNALHQQMVGFHKSCRDRSLTNSESWQDCVKLVSDTFVQLASVKDPECSFDFLSKSFELKDLCKIPKTKVELFVMASCQSRLEGADEPRHMQEAIQRIEQAKLAAGGNSAITDVAVHNLAGDLYDIVGNFPEAIKNYRFVLENAPNEEQKRGANLSIANALQGAREAKAKQQKLKAVGDVLIKAYGGTKASASEVVVRGSAVTREDLKEYLREELKITDCAVIKSSGALKVSLTAPLKSLLDQKVAASEQLVKGGR